MTTQVLHEVARAKINLALHVRARMPDGYHALETLFAFAQDGDRLTLDPQAPLSLMIGGRFGAGLSGENDNLIIRAARGFLASFGLAERGAFTLDKRLPIAAGIGGGSADAAAALRLMVRAHNVAPNDPRLMMLAATLGADVPACLDGRMTRGEGRGDALVPVAPGALQAMPLLLVNPGVPCPTGPVFKAWDGVDHGPLGDGDPLAAAVAGRNDLEPPARRLVPAVASAIDALAAQPGVLLARMSGSGATAFALFDGLAARDAAAAAIGTAQPGWWQMASRIA
ncbi:4-diphosphocytidyl-2-C-methyl-D-erythritol kinase [Sphingomonas zeicaulis]|uniref:4-(cytidine 5'-diphospho)-2-C-methyl-D-erythritol kinase n=1 Tax=Sphingomonas zeicaulis TaxID=1632740 RepID=UPI003D1D9BF1